MADISNIILNGTTYNLKDDSKNVVVTTSGNWKKTVINSNNQKIAITTCKLSNQSAPLDNSYGYTYWHDLTVSVPNSVRVTNGKVFLQADVNEGLGAFTTCVVKHTASSIKYRIMNPHRNNATDNYTWNLNILIIGE